MGEINLDPRERQAIATIDRSDLQALIDSVIAGEHPSVLRRLPLSNCSPCLGSKLHHFELAFADHAKAKSAKKREETRYYLEKAGRDLSFGLDMLKERLAQDLTEGVLFRVDDHILWPTTFHPEMSVAVRYRWRPTVEAEWSRGHITFTHRADIRPDAPTPRRKPSAATLARELQERLFTQWQYLMRGALYSVRDYFRVGGDGAAIPKTFTAVTDRQGNLNNHSTRFWGDAHSGDV